MIFIHIGIIYYSQESINLDKISACVIQKIFPCHFHQIARNSFKSLRSYCVEPIQRMSNVKIIEKIASGKTNRIYQNPKYITFYVNSCQMVNDQSLTSTLFG